MKVKVSEAAGSVLDWMVAKALGKKTRRWAGILHLEDDIELDFVPTWNPSADWSQGGPIVEREGLAIWQSADPSKGKWCSADARWMDLDPESDEFTQLPDPWHAPAPLIAAMRCFCSVKLGDYVDVPEELCQQQKS